ncbi:odorant-binding protein 2b isoform X3 [Pteropus medius]|nr:odorant-binding protein 2b isoform X3 [Pteropus giganteus]
MDRDIPELKVEAAAPLIFEPLDGYRKINAKYTILVQGQCHTLKTVLKKVPGPGEYVSTKYKSLLRFKPLPVKDHYVVYCDSEVQGQVVHEAKLIGRDKSKSQESLAAFKNEVSANGSNPENIIFPRQIAACPEDEQ